MQAAIGRSLLQVNDIFRSEYAVHTRSAYGWVSRLNSAGLLVVERPIWVVVFIVLPHVGDM